MKKSVLIISAILTLFFSPTIEAAEENDTTFEHLYSRVIELYNASSKDTQEEFYRTAEKLSTYCREHNRKSEYYKIQLNICFYETNHGHSLQALKRANEMLENMKKENYDGYSEVYLALANIFECRGNYRMAREYYEKSLDTQTTESKKAKINIYLRIANLMIYHQPVESEYWIRKCLKEEMTPYHKQITLFIESMISFVLISKHEFKENYNDYLNFHNKNQKLDNYGMESLQIANLAFDGKYEEALKRLQEMSNNELTIISALDMRTVIYKMAKDYEKALETEQIKTACIDSLNSDMFYLSVSELNAQIGLAQAESKANKDREVMLDIILVLAIVVIVLLVLYIIHNRKRKTILKQKNEQLRTALEMAEESDKMKTEFVRSVSHEIRTPLNAINGFNDILNTPGITLSEEERADLLKRIKDNVKAITDIVDEMLGVSDKESNVLYSEHTKILCNQFFSTLLYQYRNSVSSSIELKYTSRLVNRFQIETNEEGIKKIMEQLIQNAIKFTKSGSIVLHCELIDDSTKLAISITDTGKGVSEDQQDKIFDGFYKEDVFQQGIGLGLTISKKIAIKLGGELVLDKDYKDGARFILTLPV